MLDVTGSDYQRVSFLVPQGSNFDNGSDALRHYGEIAFSYEAMEGGTRITTTRPKRDIFGVTQALRQQGITFLNASDHIIGLTH